MAEAQTKADQKGADARPERACLTGDPGRRRASNWCCRLVSMPSIGRQSTGWDFSPARALPRAPA